MRGLKLVEGVDPTSGMLRSATFVGALASWPLMEKLRKVWELMGGVTGGN